MKTNVVIEKGETVEAVAETATEAEIEGVIVETIAESAAEDRRIRRKPSWMKDYHMSINRSCYQDCNRIEIS